MSRELWHLTDEYPDKSKDELRLIAEMECVRPRHAKRRRGSWNIQ